MRSIIMCLALVLICSLGFSQSLSNYVFSSSNETYTEIEGGILLGSTTSISGRYCDPSNPTTSTSTSGLGFPLGFTFYYGGYEFDRVGISTEGWLGLGQSWLSTPVNIGSSSQNLPLSSTTSITPAWLVSRIAALGVDLSPQTDATLRIETIGTSPNRIFVAQWKNYRKAGTGVVGDSYNFQIRLEETTNRVVIAYGEITNNATQISAQVGLRGEPASSASNFSNRSTTSDWSATAAGTAATDNCTLSNLVYPANGTAFIWTPPVPISGTWTIGTAGAFTSFTAAINYLNTNLPLYGLGSGGITFNVAAGSVFAENPPAINVTGFLGKPIKFKKNGEGNNPIIMVDGTTGSSDAGIQINGGDYFTFDGIDIANIEGSTRLEYGYYLLGLANDPLHDNTITNCTVTLSTTNANTNGIYILGVTNGKGYNNTLETNTINNANTGIRIDGSSTVAQHNEDNALLGNTLSNIRNYGIYHRYCINTQISNNSISMISGNATAYYGIWLSGVSATAAFENNQVIGATTSTSYSGIYCDRGTYIISNNTVTGLNGTGSSSRYGIYVNYGSNTISGNEVHSLSAVGDMFGIVTSTYSDTNVIIGNKIHNLSSTGTSSYECRGIVVYGVDVSIVNNLIYNLSSNGSAAPQVAGIVCQTGTSYKIYHNSVFLKSGSAASNFSSAALLVASNNPSLDIRNNIFENLSTPGNTGRTVALWKSVAGISNFATSTDCNIYYADEPGVKNLIYYNSSSSDACQSLLDYKNLVVNFDQGSFTEEVPFVSIEFPYDLHVRSDVPTRVEGNATPIAGVVIDFDNQERNALAPDVGADEGDFMPFSAAPHFANLVSPTDGNFLVAPSETLNWTANLEGGIPSGYRLNLGTDNPPSNIEENTDLGNNFTYTPSAPLAYLTTYYWQIIPYNAVGEATDCPVWSFTTYDAPLTGIKTIGSSSNYPSFSLAIMHLNASGVGVGGVTFEVASGEVFAENPPVITATGTAANPVLFTSDNNSRTNPLITPLGGGGSFGIKISGGDYICFDHIDISNISGANNLVYGYWIEGLANNGASYNKITNCNVTLSRNVTSYGIYLTSPSNGINYGAELSANTITNAKHGINSTSYNQNTIIQNNVLDGVTLNGIYLSRGINILISQNQISFPSGATEALYGINLTTQTNASVSYNTVSGGNTTGGVFTGLFVSGSTGVWNNNTISNVSASGDVNGINADSGTLTISNNKVYGLSSANHCIGININYYSSPLTTTTVGNKIYNLSSTTSSSRHVYGINSDGTNLIYNNMIYDLRNNGGSSAPQVRALALLAGNNKVFYNTVWVNTPAGTNAAYSTAALYIEAGTNHQISNNIFMNSSSSGANGRATAFWKTTAGFASINVASNRNIYYSGVPSAQNLICYNATTGYQTLTEYKVAVLTFDQGSLTEAVPLASMVEPYDVHIDTSSATRAESNAIPIDGIEVDFDGNLRNETTPDIGADEGDFLIPQLPPEPTCLVYPVVDAYAVSITPNLVWFPSSEGGAPTGYKLLLGTDYTLFDPDDAIDLGNVVSHQVSVPLAYLTTYYWMIVPYNDNGFATNCPVWRFETHDAPLTGIYSIGSTGYYPDFTHAINHLNASGVGSGGVAFNVSAGEVFTENPPIIIVTGTSANPIVFQSDGLARINPLIKAQGGTDSFGIKIEGGDYITFNSIDIANQDGATNLVHGYWILALTGNGATNNIIKNCQISLDLSLASYGIRSASGSGRLNHNNLYQNNTINNARNGIYLAEYSSVQNTTVQNNTINNASAYGVYIQSGTSCVISGNTISMNNGNTQTFYGIYVNTMQTGSQIFGNTISGGTTSSSFYGIYLYQGTHYVYNNSISSLTSSGRFWGISNYSGTVHYYNNEISNLVTTSGSSCYGIDVSSTSQVYDNHIHNLSSSGTLYGIYLSSNSSVFRNQIHNLQTNSTSSGVVHGMFHASGTCNIYNNLIYDLHNPGGTTAPQVRAFTASGGSSNMSHNTVFLHATGSCASFSTAALYFTNTGGTNTFRNNIFDNRSTPGANGRTVAFWKTTEAFAVMAAASNNNIWYAGTPSVTNLICVNATTNCLTLADYKALNTGKDQNSFTEAVPYLSATSPHDLHINPSVETIVESNAVVISTITTDFESNPRDPVRPDIGAFEGNYTPISGPPAAPNNLSPADAATNVALNAALNWAMGNGGGLPDSYNVFFGTVTPPPFVASTINTSYSPVLVPETTYFWQIEAVNDLGNEPGAIWSFTTRNDYTIVELPYTESFETNNTNGSSDIYRWTKALGSGSAYWTVNTNTTYNRTPRTGSYNITLIAGGDAWIFRPIYLDEGTAYELELWARQNRDSGSNGLVEVKFGNNPQVSSMTQSIITTTEFINGDYQRAKGVFAPTTSGLYYLGIHGNCLVSTNFLSLDDISVSVHIPTPAFSISPSAWNFGPVTVDTSSPTQNFIISNTGDADLLINNSDISITGDDAEHFILTEVPDDLVLQPAQTAMLYVTFAPLTTGYKNASLQIVDNTAGRATQLIPLTGRGMGPLDPPFVMDFEDNWDDWMVINGGQPNKWETGAASRYRNQKAAYISADAGTSNFYSNNLASIVHFYHDVRFPADVSNLLLNFNWKGIGEPGFDYLTVHIAEQSYIPEAGLPVASGQIGTQYANAADWQFVSLPIDPSNAGQIKRLIFSWRNDVGGGQQPPVAIDNIRIVTGSPELAVPQNLNAISQGNNAVLSWDFVPFANEYVIEDSDMFDGEFLPVGRSGNPTWSVPGSYPRRFFRVRATD